MQDQGRRLLLAVAVALGVMMVWNLVFPSKEEPKPDPSKGSAAVMPVRPPSLDIGGGSATATAPTPDPVPAGSGAEAVAPPPTPTPPPAEVARGPEQLIELPFPGRLTAKFSNYGGALVSWKLADPRFGRDATKGELLPPANKFPERGAFGVNFSSDSTYHLPAHSEWKGEKVSDTQVRYTFSTENVDVEKLYTIDSTAYLVRMTTKLTFKVPAGKEAYQTLLLLAHEYQDPKLATEGESSQSQARAWHSSTLRKDDDGSIMSTGVVDLIKGQQTDGRARYEKDFKWTGYEHPYLLVAFAPKPENPTTTFEKRTVAEDSGLMKTAIYFPRVTVKAGDPAVTREVVAYLGPKNYKDLEHADEVAGFDTGFKTPIDLGWFAFIGRPLMWLLLKFYSVVGNWGIAIMLLTFLVKGATIYWTTKSMRSMKSMAALAPQMKALQARYKDDKQRLQAETMALYKQHNVNPIAGCLPIFLQMPIWLALYRMLSSAGELYHQPFITGWINDLTAPDPTHILPIVLVITMFLQARMTPTGTDAMQQKIMQYGMPLMFGVMSFFFPAGLTLYIFTNTLLSALHSIYMNKYDKKSLAIAEMMKQNKAKADEAKEAEERAKTKASGAKDVKDAKAKAKGDGKPALSIEKLKAKATDTSSEANDESDASDEESDESEADIPASASASQAGRPRPRRKKRRR
ncbi:MAG: membrane protein insertase YidC [Deltaproteobacteria bacterium]|nr:membrane protein insertase YidC [Deltaproteobacteria bacterium]